MKLEPLTWHTAQEEARVFARVIEGGRALESGRIMKLGRKYVTVLLDSAVISELPYERVYYPRVIMAALKRIAENHYRGRGAVVAIEEINDADS